MGLDLFVQGFASIAEHLAGIGPVSIRAAAIRHQNIYPVTLCRSVNLLQIGILPLMRAGCKE